MFLFAQIWVLNSTQVHSMCTGVGGGVGHFINFLVGGVQNAVKNGLNWIEGFVKMWGQKDLITMTKGVNWF